MTLVGEDHVDDLKFDVTVSQLERKHFKIITIIFFLVGSGIA